MVSTTISEGRVYNTYSPNTHDTPKSRGNTRCRKWWWPSVSQTSTPVFPYCTFLLDLLNQGSKQKFFLKPGHVQYKNPDIFTRRWSYSCRSYCTFLCDVITRPVTNNVDIYLLLRTCGWGNMGVGFYRKLTDGTTVACHVFNERKYEDGKCRRGSLFWY